MSGKVWIHCHRFGGPLCDLEFGTSSCRAKLRATYGLLRVENGGTFFSHNALYPFHLSRGNAGEKQTTHRGNQKALWEGLSGLFLTCNRLCAEQVDFTSGGSQHRLWLHSSIRVLFTVVRLRRERRESATTVVRFYAPCAAKPSELRKPHARWTGHLPSVVRHVITLLPVPTRREESDGTRQTADGANEREASVALSAFRGEGSITGAFAPKCERAIGRLRLLRVL